MFKTVVAPRRGEPIVEPTNLATRRMAEYMELMASVVNHTRMEVVALGDWNMNTTTNVDIPHGLEYADIIKTKVFIRNDADTARDNIGVGASVTDTTPQGYAGTTDSTNVNIVRLTGGKFDAAGYSSTSYNRGWLIVTYINQ